MRFVDQNVTHRSLRLSWGVLEEDVEAGGTTEEDAVLSLHPKLNILRLMGLNKARTQSITKQQKVTLTTKERVSGQ